MIIGIVGGIPIAPRGNVHDRTIHAMKVILESKLPIFYAVGIVDGMR